jgi:hypothetical protein
MKHLNLIFLHISILFVINALGGLRSTTPFATYKIFGKYFNGIFFYFNITWSKIVNFLSASAYNAFKPARSLVLY